MLMKVSKDETALLGVSANQELSFRSTLGLLIALSTTNKYAPTEQHRLHESTTIRVPCHPICLALYPVLENILHLL
jgi:hypothetical protein